MCTGLLSVAFDSTNETVPSCPGGTLSKRCNDHWSETSAIHRLLVLIRPDRRHHGCLFEYSLHCLMIAKRLHLKCQDVGARPSQPIAYRPLRVIDLDCDEGTFSAVPLNFCPGKKLIMKKLSKVIGVQKIFCLDRAARGLMIELSKKVMDCAAPVVGSGI